MRSWFLLIPVLALGVICAARATEDPGPAASLPPVRIHLVSLGSPSRLIVRSAGCHALPE